MVKAVFVDFHKHFYDRHPVYSIASTLASKNHKVFYLSNRNTKVKNAVNILREIKPDLLLYSSFTSSIPEYAQFDEKIYSG